MQITRTRLKLENITKHYPGIIANDSVNMSVLPGEIHALLGENGAGKSTLVKFIYGVHGADGGRMLWEDKEIQISNPSEARKTGIGMVFQHFSLFDALTVEENIAIGISQELATGGLSDKIIQVSNQYGLPLDPSRYVYTLSVGERQRIEVVRCLLQNPRLLIMDEPTSVLTPQEVEELFKTLRRLSDEGISILYISHKLQEIKDLCHKATIMRNGKVVSECNPDDETTRSMAEMMMGKGFISPERRENKSFGSTKLSLRNINRVSHHQHGVDLANIDLDIKTGEVVGIAGIAGNGQTELLEVLSGEVPVGDEGIILLGDREVTNLNTNDRRKIGMAFVPEERLGHGAVPNMSLWENTVLSAAYSMDLVIRGFISKVSSIAFCKHVIKKFNVHTPGPNAFASALSGGNLQKFIFGREILQNPQVLIVLQPTWGVDAGSAARIRQSLIDLTENEAAVLVISQDLEELLEISDRIAVIHGGKLSPAYPVNEITIEEIGLLMGGVKKSEFSIRGTNEN